MRRRIMTILTAGDVSTRAGHSGCLSFEGRNRVRRWPRLARRLAVGVLLAGVGTSVEAQEVATSIDQLGSLVKPGENVTVTDNSGRQLTGRIATLSASSLALLVDGNERAIAETDVATIYQHHRDSLINGTVFGAVIGAASGAVLTALMSEDSDTLADHWGWVSLFAGLGAGTGLGIDAVIPGRRIIYERAKRAGLYSVSPMLTATRRGVRMTVSF